MQERLAHSLSSEGWVKKDDRILVAVSGGVDSLTLLRLLHDLGYTVVAAHCNFQLRGKESDEDAEFVKKVCKELGITCLVRAFHTQQFAKTSGLGIQEAARNLRYDWFEQMRKQHDCRLIATAHHKTDHLETVLINQIRGTGIKGFTGIQHRPKDHIVRPLLAFNSDEIRAFAKTKNWEYREDSSNAKDDYLRNQLRHHVIPALRSIDNHVEGTFSQNSQKVLEHLSLYNKLVDNAIERITEQKEDTIQIQIQATLSYPQPQLILYRILNEYGFTRDQCKQMTTAKTGAIFHSTSHILTRDRTYWILTKFSQPKSLEIRTIGNYRYGDITISITQEDNGQTIERSKSVIYVDPRQFASITVRNWQEGDRIQPFGMKGSKLVSDVFTDNKIPNSAKNQVPIFCNGQDIIWVGGLCFSHKFKLDLVEGRLKSGAWRIALSSTVF